MTTLIDIPYIQKHICKYKANKIPKQINNYIFNINDFDIFFSNISKLGFNKNIFEKQVYESINNNFIDNTFLINIVNHKNLLNNKINDAFKSFNEINNNTKIMCFRNKEMYIYKFLNNIIIFVGKNMIFLNDQIQYFDNMNNLFITLNNENNIYGDLISGKSYSKRISDNKIIIQQKIMSNKILTFSYKKYYNEIIIDYIDNLYNPEKIVKYDVITIYYPKDIENQTISIVSKTKTGDNTQNNSILRHRKNGILYKAENGNIMINKTENLYVKERKTAIYGYKIGKLKNDKQCIIELIIPIDAKIVQPNPSDGQVINQQKFRCNKAIVSQIYDIDNNKLEDEIAYSGVYSKKIEYKINTEVFPDAFDEDPDKICARGIHFHVYKEYCNYWIKDNDLKITNYQRPLDIPKDKLKYD